MLLYGMLTMNIIIIILCLGGRAQRQQNHCYLHLVFTLSIMTVISSKIAQSLLFLLGY